WLLPDDRQHRLVVVLRFVYPVQEVDRSGPRGGEADADLPGPLRVRARHEGGLLLVPHLDELQLVLVALERADDRVDPVAGIAVDAFDTVLDEPFQDEVCGQLGHWLLIPGAPGSKRAKRPEGRSTL